MILDTLKNARRYGNMHPGFVSAFQFLSRPDLASLADGRHDVNGDELFAIVDHGMGRGREQSLLEFHRKYIDIQFVVDGCDQIGWMSLDDCQRISQPYDSERDLGFYFDRPATWLEVPAGSFTVFYPEDAHAPLGGTEPIIKVVLKIAV